MMLQLQININLLENLIMTDNQKNIKYLRETQVAELTGLSKTTRWRLEKLGIFPKRRQLSMRTTIKTDDAQ